MRCGRRRRATDHYRHISGEPVSKRRLLISALRLTADLDEARLFLAAAYVSMAADAIRNAADTAQAEDGRIDIQAGC